MPAEDAKLDEQAFLLDFFQQTVVANQDYTYSNFVQLQGDPTGIMNKLMAGGGQEIFDLRTEQLPLMVPKIQLYKVYHTSDGKGTFEEEFIFDDRTSLNSIVESSRGRGSDVGLKSFTWNDMGTTPGDSGLSFEATLKLYFQSFDGVFKVRKQTKRGKVSFADLLVPQKAKGIPSGPRKAYDDSDYQIKVVVGWAVPDDPGRVIFKNPSVLEKCQTSFLLTLITHEIDIKEDGSIELTLDYIAALEGRMLSPKSDLLYVRTADNISELQEKRNRLRNQKIRSIGEKEQEWWDLTDLVFGEDAVEKRQKDIEQLEKDVDRLSRVARLESYSRLLRKLEGTSRRIIYFSLNQTQIQTYLLIGETTFEHIKDPVARERELKDYRKTILNKIPTLGGGDFSLTSANKNEAHNTLQKLNRKIVSLGGDEDAIKKAIQEAKKEAGEQNLESTYDINFFFLGDLFSAALEIIYEEDAKGKKSVDSKDQFRFMLGTIDLVNPTNGSLEAVPLSDIPISLSTFNIWFQENIIKPQRDRLPFWEFVRRICSELIVGSLNPLSYGDLGKSTNTRTSLSNFLLADGALPTGGRQQIWDLRNTLRQQTSHKSAANLKQYLFMYIGGAIGNALRGKLKEDTELGIFHLYSGADKGAIKKISFQRTDLPFQRESRIASAKGSASSNLLFSDAYSCQITMIGNPVFKPGMLVFVDPASMGLGSATSLFSDAAKIGIGGYYLITKVESIIEEGKFETNLSTESQVPIPYLKKVERSQRTVANTTNPSSPVKKLGDPPKRPRKGVETVKRDEKPSSTTGISRWR